MRNLGVDYLFHEIELPLAGVLADMESEGVAIDVPYLKQMQDELGAQLAAIEKEVEDVAGQKFNLNAPQQLAKILFEDLRLPVGKRTKTGYSTDADTLETLREKHPIIGLILEHRQLSKLKSTYVDALPQLVTKEFGIEEHGDRRLEPRVENGVKVFNLEVSVIRWHILPDVAVDAFAFADPEVGDPSSL